MSRILRQRGREPDPVIWICNEGKNLVEPPIWFVLIRISATVYDPVTQVRQITYQLSATDPNNPPLSFFQVVHHGDGTFYGTIQNDGTPRVIAFNQNQNSPVMVIELWGAATKVATQYDQPPKHAF